MNSRRPTVSVVMSEYNTNPDHLKLSIQSILDQTYRDFEFLIVDDCSSNDLEKVIDCLGNDKRITVLKNDRNRGLVYSLNRAIKKARAPYLVRMDTDDIAMPDRIATLYKFIATHQEYSVVGSRAIEINSQGKKNVIGKSGHKTAQDIMRGDTPIHPSVIMNKTDIICSGGYSDYTRAEDLALWCELLLQGKRIYVIDDILLQYRVEDADYRKRSIRRRGGEIKARLHYYPMLGAGLREYWRVIKSIIAGMVPASIMRLRKKRSL